MSRYNRAPMITIYVIENTVNGKCYVGRTDWLKGRIDQHFCSPSRKAAIGQAIRQHGIDSFIVRKVDTAPDSRTSGLRERFWIHLLEADDPRFGYNIPSKRHPHQYR